MLIKQTNWPWTSFLCRCKVILYWLKPGRSMFPFSRRLKTHLQQILANHITEPHVWIWMSYNKLCGGRRVNTWWNWPRYLLLPLFTVVLEVCHWDHLTARDACWLVLMLHCRTWLELDRRGQKLVWVDVVLTVGRVNLKSTHCGGLV